MGYEVKDFNRDVIERSHRMPVLVDFWAEWCGPCRVLGPVIEGMAEQNRGRWELVKVNTEEHPEIAEQYGIRSIPNVKMFVDGEVRDEFLGALPAYMIEQWLKKALPSRYRHRLLEAQELLNRGQFDRAEAALKEILEAEPDNHQAALLLAQGYLTGDPDRAIALLKPIQPDSEYFDLAEALRTIARLFIHQHHPEALPEDPVRAAYLRAIAALRADDFARALDGFIDVLERNRRYDDDGARRACIAIFRVLGEDHEITRHYRRPFSNALYA
jgi:putative thioredoxin